MERTESIVIQVAQDLESENFKIKEMEAFGWNLQGRQEIHGEGEAYIARKWGDDFYIEKTRVSNYIKLHFVRSLSLPNLDKIKALEEEYFSLTYPKFPNLIPGGCLLLLFCWPYFPIYWPLWYFLGYKPRKAKAEAKLAEVVAKEEEIISRVTTLLKNSLKA